ncbi:MAG: glycosyltransferase [Verrucomicrobiota bacterium]|nr:glycosyltransferase [Verrucomicrobiota bacterium]
MICTLIIPCYRDADCLQILIPALIESCRNAGLSSRVVVINDFPFRDEALERVCATNQATIIPVPYNMGHQEALVFGIKRCLELFPSAQPAEEIFVTLDADGQDDPRAVPALVGAVQPGTVVVAQRAGQRPEGWKFRLFYGCYKRVFRLLVGFYPDFGNFAAFDADVARQIALSPHFDMAYSLALPLVARLQRIPVARLPRIKGESRFSFEGLIDHAFRLFIPHWKRIVRRVFIASALIIGVSVLFGLFTASLRIFLPRYAFPNWASTINFGVAIISLQLLTLSALTFFVGSISRQISITARQVIQHDTPSRPKTPKP